VTTQDFDEKFTAAPADIADDALPDSNGAATIRLQQSAALGD
jgi:hypothetical protein